MKLNKNSILSNLILIFLPIISELLLKKGKRRRGKEILLNVIFLNFSRVFIWSRKFIPNIIGQYGNLSDILFQTKTYIIIIRSQIYEPILHYDTYIY